MGSIGTTELLLIFVVVLLVFGAKRIPEIARNMGTALREFKAATRDIQRQFDAESYTNSAPRPAANNLPATRPTPAAGTDADTLPQYQQMYDAYPVPTAPADAAPAETPPQGSAV